MTEKTQAPITDEALTEFRAYLEARSNKGPAQTVLAVAKTLLAEVDRCRKEQRDDRQRRIAEWTRSTFGPGTMTTPERTARFLEEALELAQACGYEREPAERLVAYVFSRPVGDYAQELGGVGITLLALAEALCESADAAERRELARVLAIPVEHFRKRHDAKAAAGIGLSTAEAFASEVRQ